MKKISSADTINFAVSGTSKYVITPEGVLVTDIEARILSERLGATITITDMEPDEIQVPVVEEASPVVNPPADAPVPAPEPAPADVVAPVDPLAAPAAPETETVQA